MFFARFGFASYGVGASLNRANVYNFGSTCHQNLILYGNENTGGKAHLLSYQDYLNRELGFSSNAKVYDGARWPLTTDWARVSGVYYRYSDGYEKMRQLLDEVS